MSKINFYNQVKKTSKIINPNYEKHKIDIPFRMSIAAPSGSGKTHSLCRLIYDLGKCFHEIVICVLSADEPLYELINDRLNSNNNISIFESGEIPDIKNYSIINPKTKKLQRKDDLQRLIIFDDLMLNKNSNCQIEHYYIKGRKLGFSMCYIAQNYYQIPRNIRLNSQYFILGRNILKRDIKAILTIFSIDINLDEFTKIYNILTEHNLDTILINTIKKLINRNITDNIYDFSNKNSINQSINLITEIKDFQKTLGN